ncbi:MAG: carboxymuconolactone decarboxylase family protein [Acidimicrobiia bacterium]
MTLRDLAPEPFARWDDAAAGLSSAISVDRLRQVQVLVVALLGADVTRCGMTADEVAQIAGWRDSDDLEAGERAVLEFSEQFVLDVSACTDEQRSAAIAALGADAFPYVQVLYATDFGTRMGAAWRELFDSTPEIKADSATELWPALESFMSAVARLDVLDPLTTEIVRLRGARAHNCRLCKSLRNVRAANEGADEAVYDQIEHYQASALSLRHQTALRLVDTMIWEPCSYPSDLPAAVHAAFTDAEAVELVLDIARNAANKIAVAFGADESHITEGVEFYDIDERGELIYGLAPNR